MLCDPPQLVHLKPTRRMVAGVFVFFFFAASPVARKRSMEADMAWLGFLNQRREKTETSFLPPPYPAAPFFSTLGPEPEPPPEPPPEPCFDLYSTTA